MAKYVKQDCETGYITNNVDIEYLKFNNLRHSVLGFMLGDFDDKGNYYISPDIVKELVDMKKYFSDSVDNIDVCYSAIKLDKQLTFLVTFEKDKATLSLVERMSYEANFKLDSGAYSNMNEYILDQVETSGEINRNLIYKRWNISLYGGEVLDIFNMDEQSLALCFNLSTRFKYLLEANTILLDKEEELDELEAEYSVKMLEMLKKYPALKTIVDKDIKSALTKEKGIVRADKPNFAKTINEILNQSIEDNIDQLDENLKQDFLKEKEIITQENNIKRRDILDIKEERKSDDIDLSDNKIIVLKTNKSGTMSELGQGYLNALMERENRLAGQTPQDLTEGKTNRQKLFNYLRNEQGVSANYMLDEDLAKAIEEQKQAEQEATQENTKEVAQAQQNLVAKTANNQAERKAGSTAGRSTGGNHGGRAGKTADKEKKNEQKNTDAAPEQEKKKIEVLGKGGVGGGSNDTSKSVKTPDADNKLDDETIAMLMRNNINAENVTDNIVQSATTGDRNVRTEIVKNAAVVTNIGLINENETQVTGENEDGVDNQV